MTPTETLRLNKVLRELRDFFLDRCTCSDDDPYYHRERNYPGYHPHKTRCPSYGDEELLEAIDEMLGHQT